MGRKRFQLLGGAATLLVIVAVVAAFWFLQSDESPRLLTRLFQREDQTWSTMQTRGTWRVGMDPSFPPFENLNDDEVMVGYDVDLARAMAAEWELEAELIPIGFDSLPDALQAGRIDSIVSAFPYDPRATRDMAFSEPYFEAGVRLAVRSTSSISQTEQLDGAKVAVEWGSMGDMAGRRLQREGVALELDPYATSREAIDALVADESIDALLVDHVSLRMAQGQGADILAVGPALESNPYVIAAPLRARTLHEQVDATLQRFARNGTLAELEARWFGPLPQPTSAASD